MNKFSADQYKFKEKSINKIVNMEAIRIDSYNSLLNSDFINKLQLIESANSLSSEESSEESSKNTPKVIDDVIFCFDFNEDDNYEKL